MSERRKTIFDCEGDEFGRRTIPEMIGWLNGIAAEAPCEPGEVVFEIEQGGDQWDGYGSAEISITRPMTAEEIAEEDRGYAARQEAMAQRREEQERREFARLKAKYGDGA